MTIMSYPDTDSILHWQHTNFPTQAKKILTGRIRTIDLGITIEDIYSPPLYQLSYGELDIGGR